MKNDITTPEIELTLAKKPKSSGVYNLEIRGKKIKFIACAIIAPLLTTATFFKKPSKKLLVFIYFIKSAI
ncbi:hypothetical protein VPR01S_04_01910 [Vibrio proteolyticus NBRC 13287]|uniref:Uncharacterized protein n=1 Tax=Vibrio proteolyticus NBRC 13287 TaxID=1219065 RepID=U2ZFW7_VIBPR|nr:hypothetical protein VPR01S_04_01910 [Vibrio proteolyticus NBRC 13287]